MRCSLAASCFIASLLMVASSLAAEPAAPSFQINGFGTLGVARSSDDQADYTSTVRQPNGAGHSHEWAPGVDSQVGLQLTGNITSRLTAVVQVISAQRYDSSYSPTLEWANIKYDFTPDLSLRFGRTVLPTFMASDYRKVSYALPWVRPPGEVYNLAPMSNSDGIDATYRFRVGALTNTLQAFYGWNDSKFPTEGKIESRDTVSISSTAEWDDAVIRVGYLRSTLNAASTGVFFDLFRQFGPSGVALADRYDYSSKQISLWSVGGRYDPGKWFVQSELGRTKSHSLLGTRLAWYGTAGYRWRELTPYVGFAQRRKLSKSSDPGLNVAALPAPLQGFAAGLNTGLDAALNGNEFDTVSVGARWDFMRNMSLKLQLDHVRLDNDSHGDLTSIQQGFDPGGNVNVFSATIDFVF